eukprot:3640845-Rhodomonas_salina.1
MQAKLLPGTRGRSSSDGEGQVLSSYGSPTRCPVLTFGCAPTRLRYEEILTLLKRRARCLAQGSRFTVHSSRLRIRVHRGTLVGGHGLGFTARASGLRAHASGFRLQG